MEMIMEPQKAAQSVEEFAEDNGISRTTTYVEIREGRLRANKVGSRTIITSENAKKWREKLPAVGEWTDEMDYPSQ